MADEFIIRIDPRKRESYHVTFRLDIEKKSGTMKIQHDRCRKYRHDPIIICYIKIDDSFFKYITIYSAAEVWRK